MERPTVQSKWIVVRARSIERVIKLAMCLCVDLRKSRKLTSVRFSLAQSAGLKYETSL